MIPRGAVEMVICPVHKLLVATDADGRLLGRCQDCAGEAARAQRMIERGELATQLLLSTQGSV